MRKFLSILMVLVYLFSGTAWARHKKSANSSGSSSLSSTHKKHSKKKKAKAKSKKASKAAKKTEAKVQTGIGQSDVVIDLKGQ